MSFDVTLYILAILTACVRATANELTARGGSCQFDWECRGSDVCFQKVCLASSNWVELSRGAVIIIAIGCVFVLGLLITIMYWCCCRVKPLDPRLAEEVPESDNGAENLTSQDDVFIPFSKPVSETTPMPSNEEEGFEKFSSDKVNTVP